MGDDRSRSPRQRRVEDIQRRSRIAAHVNLTVANGRGIVAELALAQMFALVRLRVVDEVAFICSRRAKKTAIRQLHETVNGLRI